MNDHDDSSDPASQVISSAQVAEHVIRTLCRTTLTRPGMTPAEVDIVLAHLADLAAVLPQTTRQLGDILAQANEDHVLEMDTLTEINDPDLAINAARLHLDGVGEAALGLHRQLDTAHNETAHIAGADRLAKHTEEDAQDSIPRAGVRRTVTAADGRRRDPIWPQVVMPQVADVGSHGGEPQWHRARRHDGRGIGGWNDTRRRGGLLVATR